MGGMDIYNKIHISNIERNTNENVWLDPGNRSWDPCITSQYPWFFKPNYHIPPLQSLCPKKNTQQTEGHPVRTY